MAGNEWAFVGADYSFVYPSWHHVALTGDADRIALYIDGQEVTELFPEWGVWDVERSPGEWVKVEGPKEFRHHLGTIINGLTSQHFLILGLWEYTEGDPGAEPGSWEHYIAFVPPWMKVWTQLRPDMFSD